MIRVLGARHLLQAALTAAALAGAVRLRGIRGRAARLPGITPGTMPPASAVGLPDITPSGVGLPGIRAGAVGSPGIRAGAARLPDFTPGTVLLAGAAADAAHAASMIALGLTRAWPLRRAAWADAVLESGLSAFGIMTGRDLR